MAYWPRTQADEKDCEIAMLPACGQAEIIFTPFHLYPSNAGFSGHIWKADVQSCHNRWSYDQRGMVAKVLDRFDFGNIQSLEDFRSGRVRKK
jgi:hypothetical protein